MSRLEKETVVGDMDLDAGAGVGAGERLVELYDHLLARYGLQGWWPLLDGGYHPGDYALPETPGQQFEVMVGAILAQNTAWANAQRAVENLARAGLLEPKEILAAPVEELAETIRPSGYYNQKALKLKNFARFLESTPLARLGELDLNDLRARLLAVNGVGPETADSMMLYALHRPEFVVDAYTRRILTRVGLVRPGEATYGGVQAIFHAALPPDQETYNEYHALLVRHAVETCRKVPLCETCFLAGECGKGNSQKR
ncbi:MAG: endonuclease III domain-containing protein [Promethearchaeota archaeon]